MPRSVLIVKLAAIGDVVMALPMVTALRAQEATTRITWLCGATVAPLLARVDGIDELVAVDDMAVLSGTRAEKARAVITGWTALSGRRFDLVLTAHSDPRYRMLAARVRARERRWLGERGPRPRLVAGRHHGDEYVRLVTEIDDRDAVRYPPPPLRAELDPEVARQIEPGRPLVALAPGGARNPARDNPLRRWPVERYVALAKLLANSCAVALTGAAEDAWIRPAFASTEVVDLVGMTSLPGLAALYTRCAAVVTHDSGPLHVARLVDAPVVALFGPTLPASVMRETPRAVALWPGASLPCAPCYDGRDFAACESNRCLQLLEPETVAAAVAALCAR